jgi:hypothetical protein
MFKLFQFIWLGSCNRCSLPCFLWFDSFVINAEPWLKLLQFVLTWSAFGRSFIRTRAMLMPALSLSFPKLRTLLKPELATVPYLLQLSASEERVVHEFWMGCFKGACALLIYLPTVCLHRLQLPYSRLPSLSLSAVRRFISIQMWPVFLCLSVGRCTSKLINVVAP